MVGGSFQRQARKNSCGCHCGCAWVFMSDMVWSHNQIDLKSYFHRQARFWSIRVENNVNTEEIQFSSPWNIWWLKHETNIKFTITIHGMIMSPCLHHWRWVNAEWTERPDNIVITFCKIWCLLIQSWKFLILLPPKLKIDWAIKPQISLRYERYGN